MFRLQHTLKSFPLFPAWNNSLAGWLRCERCVYDKGYGPMHYSTHILIQLMALSALGLHTVLCVWVDAHGCVSVSVCEFVCMCIHKHFIAVHYFNLSFTMACNIYYSSPSSIHLMPTVHLRSAYVSCTCMWPEITSVMASHSTYISSDKCNLSVWLQLLQWTAPHLQSI